MLEAAGGWLGYSLEQRRQVSIIIDHPLAAQIGSQHESFFLNYRKKQFKNKSRSESVLFAHTISSFTTYHLLKPTKSKSDSESRESLKS
jgi:hypothetical protein